MHGRFKRYVNVRNMMRCNGESDGGRGSKRSGRKLQGVSKALVKLGDDSPAQAEHHCRRRRMVRREFSWCRLWSVKARLLNTNAVLIGRSSAALAQNKDRVEEEGEGKGSKRQSGLVISHVGGMLW